MTGWSLRQLPCGFELELGREWGGQGHSATSTRSPTAASADQWAASSPWSAPEEASACLGPCYSIGGELPGMGGIPRC